MSHPFRTAVERRDRDAMVAAMAPDISFHSPVTFKPFVGRAAVAELFSNLLEVFKDFEYTEELSGDGTVVLLFRARVGDKTLQGMDYLKLGAEGLVEEFTVMLRPLSALVALSQEMGPRVGHLPKGPTPTST
jgi:hypothetical protein